MQRVPLRTGTQLKPTAAYPKGRTFALAVGNGTWDGASYNATPSLYVGRLGSVCNCVAFKVGRRTLTPPDP
jgi:hypothetical protein